MTTYRIYSHIIRVFSVFSTRPLARDTDDCQGDDQGDSSVREAREEARATPKRIVLTPTLASVDSVAVERHSKDKVSPEASLWKSSGRSFRLTRTRIPLRARRDASRCMHDGRCLASAASNGGGGGWRCTQ